MSTTRLFVIGLVLLAASGGCVTGTASVDQGVNGATASPHTLGGPSGPRCDGTYNQAAGLCVAGGG